MDLGEKIKNVHANKFLSLLCHQQLKKIKIYFCNKKIQDKNTYKIIFSGCNISNVVEYIYFAPFL